MYLLDTNVISELRTGKPQADARVLAWAASVPLAAQYVSVLTWLEIDIGILRLQRRDAAQAQALPRVAGRPAPPLTDRLLAVP